MKYFIGIDGGGTKTIAYLGNEAKELFADVQMGGTNYHSVGIDEVKKILGEILEHFKKEENISMDRIDGICFSGAGIDCKEDEANMRSIFSALGYNKGLIVCNDSVGALVGANGSLQGGILISGTGSIGIGIDNKGILHRVGGWGHIIDDGGSGYSIARDGLRYIMEAYDGRRQETQIWCAVKDYLKLTNQEDLITFLYSHDTKKHIIARLAPLIIGLYAEDEAAKEIVDNNILELCCITHSLAYRLKQKDFNLGLCGGILEGSSLIRELFIRKIKLQLPDLELHLPNNKAAMGALILAVDDFKTNKG